MNKLEKVNLNNGNYKLIEYSEMIESNNKISKITYFNNKNEKHRLDGPANIVFSTKGTLYGIGYYKHNKYYREENFPARILYRYGRPWLFQYYNENNKIIKETKWTKRDGGWFTTYYDNR